MRYRDPEALIAMTVGAKFDVDWCQIARYHWSTRQVSIIARWGMTPEVDGHWPFWESLPVSTFTQKPAFSWRAESLRVDRLPFLEPPSMGIRALFPMETKTTSHTALWIARRVRFTADEINQLEAYVQSSTFGKLRHTPRARRPSAVEAGFRLSAHRRRQWAHQLRGPAANKLLLSWLALQSAVDQGTPADLLSIAGSLDEVRHDITGTIAQDLYPADLEWSLAAALRQVAKSYGASMHVAQPMKALDHPLESPLPNWLRLALIDVTALVLRHCAQQSIPISQIWLTAHAPHRVHLRFFATSAPTAEISLADVRNLVHLLRGTFYQRHHQRHLLDLCLPYGSSSTTLL